MILEGVITTDQLRQEIGGATGDTADPGFVSDEMLDNIRQRKHDEALGAVKKLIGESVMRGQSPAPSRLFDPRTVSMEESDDRPGLLEGEFPGGYYPWVERAVDDQGRELTFDPHINRTVRTAFVPRYVFYLSAGTIYCNPEIGEEDEQIQTLNLHVAKEKDLYNHLTNGEILGTLNNGIVKAAQLLLDSRIKEGSRLEQILQSDDGVPGDLS